MPGPNWTAPELEWVLANPEGTYEQFLARGWKRSYDAFRVMRNNLRRNRHTRVRVQHMLVGDQDLGLQTRADEPSDEDYERFFSLIEDAEKLKAHLTPHLRSTTFVAPDDGKPIGIAFTGDWHLGAGGVDVARLRADLDAIRQTEGCYAVGMGDWLEGVTLDVKAAGSLFSGAINDPNWQEVYVLSRARLLEGRWLAILTGNHDEMVGRRTGIRRMDQLAESLGAPHFGEGGGTIVCHVGDQVYRLGVKHNHAGKALNTTNAQRRYWDEAPEWENHDLVCLAHLHFNDLHTATRKGGRVIYLRSGTYKIADAYARKFGFESEIGTPLAILLPDEHKIVPWRGDDFREGLEYLTWRRQGGSDGAGTD